LNFMFFYLKIYIYIPESVASTPLISMQVACATILHQCLALISLCVGCFYLLSCLVA
jgi:hypothetical protein